MYLIYMYKQDLTLNNVLGLKCHKTQTNYTIMSCGGVLVVLMVKAMDYGIVVIEFELQSRYYIHFRINTLEKGVNCPILPAMG